jgi:HAD superfamily phosphoserine phosphatase-like hydrolase
MKSCFRAVILDLDDTLTSKNSLHELTQVLGIPAADLAAFIRACHSGAIDPGAAGGELLALLTSARGRVSRQAVETVFQGIELRSEVLPLLSAIRAANCAVGLISSSFDRYVSIMADRLRIRDYHSNIRMEFDAADELSRIDLTVDAAGLKHRQLHQFCRRYGQSPAHVLVVGDNYNDLEMFACTGNGVLVDCPHNRILRATAWQVVTTLDQIEQLLQTRPAERTGKPFCGSSM